MTEKVAESNILGLKGTVLPSTSVSRYPNPSGTLIRPRRAALRSRARRTLPSREADPFSPVGATWHRTTLARCLVYIAKNEVPSFADSAAISATLQLDDTSAGITRAQAAVTNAATGTNALKWDMATKTITNITVTFAKGYDNTPNTADSSTWSSNPADPTNYRFTRVVAAVDVPLTFMQAF
jgi:hypothetical protein